jgi:hypothetical protein
MNIALNNLGTFDVNHMTGVRHWSDITREKEAELLDELTCA